MLGTNGAAAFAIQASTLINYGQAIPLVACSTPSTSPSGNAGTESGSVRAAMAAMAEVRVGRPLPANAVLEVSGSLEVTSVPIACRVGSAPSCDAPSLRRARRLEVRAVSGDEAKTPLVGTPVDVLLSLDSDPKKPNAPGAVAWLATSAECPVNQVNHLHRVLDPIADFYLCADGHEAAYRLSVLANGTYAGSDSSAAPLELEVNVYAQPAFVTTAAGCGDGGAGGGTADPGALVQVLDCESQPIEGQSVVAGQTTDVQGTACVEPTGEGVFLTTCNDNPIPVESEVAK